MRVETVRKRERDRERKREGGGGERERERERERDKEREKERSVERRVKPMIRWNEVFIRARERSDEEKSGQRKSEVKMNEYIRR